ncbi:MAG: XRE family transcriptional regulator [Bacteroidota bacterium]
MNFEFIKFKTFSFASALFSDVLLIGRYQRYEVKPSIEVASKVADEFHASLDYLMGKTDFELDKSIVSRVVAIQSLPDGDREHILYALDGLLQNVRTKMAFAK